MRTLRLFGAFALAGLVGACAPETETDEFETEPATETPAPVPAPAEPADEMDQPIQMNPIGASQVTGEVRLEEEDGGMQVTVHLRNSTDGAVHKGHIHSGTCDSPGAAVAPLQDITIGSNGEGESESDVEVPMATLMDGQHIVAYHEANADPGAPVVCAAIPGHQM